MKCTSMIIQNFMGIGKANLDLADKGLVAIQGVNLQDTSADSNGAGKSSFADALFWCLYGETARDKLGADEVVNRTAGKDCEVKTVWEDATGSYTITRWRKKSSAPKKSGVSLSFKSTSGAETSLTKGTDALTQVEIDKAIGCDREVYTAAVYAGQEKLPNLPAMGDSDLKQLIEKASGVDILVKAYAIARLKLKDAENGIDRWRSDNVFAERQVTDTKRRLDELIVQRDAYEGKRRDSLELMRKSLRDHVAHAKAKQFDRDSIDKERLEKTIDELDAQIAAVNTEQTEEDALREDERQAQSQLTLISSHYNRAVEDARSQKLRVEQIDNRVGTPCGECGKPYEDHDIEGARKIATASLRDLVKRAKELKEDLDAQQGVLDRRSKLVLEHRASRTDITATVEKRRRLAERLAERRRLDDAVAAETNAARRYKEQIDTLTAETNPFIELVKGATREFDDAFNDHRDSDAQGIELEKRVMVCRDVVKVYGPAGVRAHILDTVTPFLNERTSEYLGVLSDGEISAVWNTLSLNAKGELVEKFSINVTRTDGGSFASLSGGEKRKVRLATALALQDLVASRANKPFGLMIYDEVDDAMDGSGLERLMSIFEQKGRERGTVLIISHNSLKDWCRQEVTVTRKGGMSTISGCLDAS